MKREFGESIFYNIYGIYIFMFFISYSKFMVFPIVPRLYNLTLIALLITSTFFIIKNFEYTLSELLFILLISFAVMLGFYFRGYTIWITTFMMILTIKNFNLTKILMKSYLSSIISLIFVVISFKMNIISEFTLVREGNVRHSLGFSHPNFLAGILLLIFVKTLFMFYKSRKQNIQIIILTLVVIIVLNIVTGSRTSTLTAIFSWLIFFMYINIPKLFHNKKIIYVLSFSVLLGFIVSYIFAKNYDNYNPIMFTLNKLTSGRLRMANQFLLENKVNFFGNELDVLTTEKAINSGYLQTKILDNAYVSILLKYGLINVILFNIFYILSMIKMIKLNMIKEVLLILIFVVFGFFESYFTYFQFNFTILFWGLLFQGGKKNV